MITFGSHLKKLRKDMGLRQKDLAEALGLAQTTIANYEQNTRFPNEEVLKKISDYFNVSLDYLLGRTEFNGPSISGLPDVKLTSSTQSLDSIYSNYVNYILNGKKELAENLIIDSIQQGVDVKDIYLKVFEPSLKEIGLLWLQGKITVADEHHFSMVTEHIMSLTKPYHRIEGQKKHSLLALAVGGELHTIGVRMISDFFEMAGWKSYFIGANVPTISILNMIEKFDIDLIALSVSMNYHINAVETLISVIRANDTCKDVKIIVGGQGFSHDSSLWKKIGADGFALNPVEAVALGSKLVEK